MTTAATTTDPLTHEEQKALLAAAARYDRRQTGPGGDERFTEFRASEYIAFMIGTGAHPEVLSQPEKHRLRLEETDGQLYVRWTRPKKVGIRAACSVHIGPVGDAEVAWVGPFIALVTELKRSRNYWYCFTRAIWETTGLPGRCSPRTLRHTSLANVAETTADPYAVAVHGNVSVRMGTAYVLGAGARRTARIPSVMPKVHAGAAGG
jgi:integrase